MKELTATVTQRSQVTIPVEIRRLLGIKARDRVIFTIEDNQVILQPASALAAVARRFAHPTQSGAGTG